MTVDLFHVTRARDAESVFIDGLVADSETPARKENREIIREEDAGPMAPMNESATVQAERYFDEVIADAKRAVDGAEAFPHHQPANFFWPSENQARQSASGVSWGGVIVAVDRHEMPEECRCAIAPTEGVGQIFKKYYDTFRDHDTFDREKQYERAEEWWQEVESYDGQNRRNHEIWCDCDVPPYAIEWIHNPRTERRIYEPPEAGQSRLVEFEVDDG